LLLILTEEGEEIKIKIRSKIKRGTQKSELHPPVPKTPSGIDMAGYLLYKERRIALLLRMG
jgi:hypothetical protein